jgi:hypothetical protein
MSRIRASIVLPAISFITVCITNSASSQENLESGKTAAQLYATDCAICHKSPQSVTQAPGIFGLESFLREHYTASREAAASIAAYLKRFEKPSAGLRRNQTTKRTSQNKPSNAASGGSPGQKSADIPRPPANIRP